MIAGADLNIDFMYAGLSGESKGGWRLLNVEVFCGLGLISESWGVGLVRAHFRAANVYDFWGFFFFLSILRLRGCRRLFFFLLTFVAFFFFLSLFLIFFFFGLGGCGFLLISRKPPWAARDGSTICHALNVHVIIALP